MTMIEMLNIIQPWLGTGSINLFGRPFAGKDTQGQILADLLGGELIGGGDILRSYNDQSAINAIMAKGDLIPSDFYLQIMLPFFRREELADKPLMLSAVGRRSGEESIIMQATQETGHPMRAVLHLHMPAEEVWQRFEASRQQNDRGNRTDDARDVIQNRLQKYEEQTLPVIEYYRQHGLLIEVDGTQSEEAVTKSILQALTEYVKKQNSN